MSDLLSTSARKVASQREGIKRRSLLKTLCAVPAAYYWHLILVWRKHRLIQPVLR